MHYYPHHIGDFIADTARLSDSQCMAYLRLIWHYYDTELPLENDPESLAFRIGANVNDVNLILKHYFILVDGLWHKTRCDTVIDEYHGKADKAKKSAEARWNNAQNKRTDSERNANASKKNANASKIDANQEPRTNNQEPIDIKNNISAQAPSDESKKPEYPDWFMEIWKIYPERAGSNDKKKAFKSATARIKTGTTIDDLLQATKRYRNYIVATGRLGSEYVKQGATFFNSSENIESDWKPPISMTGTPNGQERAKSLIGRFIQDQYPGGLHGENSGGYVGGDDCLVREPLDKSV